MTGMPMDAVPDLPALLDAIDAGATHKHSTIHGEGHWKCVASTGLHLLPHVPGCDAAVLLLFAMLHDTQRLNDGHDSEHGPRAAALCWGYSPARPDLPAPGTAPPARARLP